MVICKCFIFFNKIFVREKKNFAVDDDVNEQDVNA